MAEGGRREGRLEDWEEGGEGEEVQGDVGEVIQGRAVLRGLQAGNRVTDMIWGKQMSSQHLWHGPHPEVTELVSLLQKRSASVQPTCKRLDSKGRSLRKYSSMQ